MQTMTGLWAVALLAGALVQSAAAAGETPCATLDAGGCRVTGGGVTIDGSLGGIGGLAIDDSAVQSLRHGYIGQLTDVTTLTVTAVPGAVNEGDSCQLVAVAGLDDATALAVAGGEIAWAVPVHPLAGIAADGQATAALVCSNTPGVASGGYLGVSGAGALLVLDRDPDNWGLYAGDGVPDGWQVGYFGPANPAGRAGATNCTGQLNRYSYIADLCPTNPASLLEIVAISNQPLARTVHFLPSSTGRQYRLLYTTNLLVGAWSNLPGVAPVQGAGGPMLLVDTNTAPARFYRIGVQLPP